MNSKNVTIIMQARIGSERLPGKVLKHLKDKSLLGHIITRLQKSKYTDGLIVATSIDAIDDPIESECNSYGVKVFRGSNLDVLSRFYHAALSNNVEHILRFCCDNPFADKDIVDETIKLYCQSSYEYVDSKKFPLGTNVEIFPFSQLKIAFENGVEPYHREHVTPYIIENSHNQATYYSDIDYSDYRFTVDTEQDWRFSKAIYDNLYVEDTYFNYKDIIEFLNKNPEIREINKNVTQKKVK